MSLFEVLCGGCPVHPLPVSLVIQFAIQGRNA
jgi:hypothetical protein